MHRNTGQLVVLTLVVVAVVVVALLLLYGVRYGPCHDTLAFQGPSTYVDVTTDAAANAVEVTVVDGDELTGAWTLSVTAVASDGDATSTYPLANRSEGLPLEPGDTRRVENVTVDGESLSSGDEVRVIWRGHERPLPGYCLTSRGNATARVTLTSSSVA